jgi:hypothetical protein
VSIELVGHVCWKCLNLFSVFYIISFKSICVYPTVVLTKLNGTFHSARECRVVFGLLSLNFQ